MSKLPPIPRETYIPDQFREAAVGYKRTAAMTFDFRDKDGEMERYHGVLATDNPEVSLQNEWCFLANVMYLGHRPPLKEFMIVIKKPSGWKKLRIYWVQSKRELKKFLQAFRTGEGVEYAHDEKYRVKFTPTVPKKGWERVI